MSSEWQTAAQPHPPVKKSRQSTHGPTMHTSRALLRAATLPRSARVGVQQLWIYASCARHAAAQAAVQKSAVPACNMASELLPQTQEALPRTCGASITAAQHACESKHVLSRQAD